MIFYIILEYAKIFRKLYRKQKFYVQIGYNYHCKFTGLPMPLTSAQYLQYITKMPSLLFALVMVQRMEEADICFAKVFCKVWYSC